MGEQIRKRDFSRTAAALQEFDAGKAERERAWNAVEKNEDVDACVAADAAALRKVQEAFHQDTSDINSLSNCLRVDEGFMRRMATGA